MADSLRDLPDHNRLLLHLPRVQVGTEWAGWVDGEEPTLFCGGVRFSLLYEFHTEDKWDPGYIVDRLAVLWQMWGWVCTEGGGLRDRRHLTGTCADGTTFVLAAAAQARSSWLFVTSPQFDAGIAGAAADVMPFAVTPFGALTLAQVWLAYPKLIVW
ncbi:DNA gyrase subunit B [Mycolicibacterium sp. Y3]